MVTNSSKVGKFLFIFTYLSIWGFAMGCVCFTWLTDIPVCSETYRLSNMVLSECGRQKEKNKPKNILNLFFII